MKKLFQVSALFALCVGILLCQTAAAQSVNAAALRKLKAATVFVEAESFNDLPQCTGFFIESNLIVTTAKSLRLTGGVVPKSIAVVVDSGEPNQKRLVAELVTYDVPNNLAFLRIAKSNPYKTRDELPLGNSKDLTETQPITMAGYPLGSQLSDNQYPSVTISPATISSFRRNEQGLLKLIQVDGNIIPGNSGGPVVDKSGQVIGMAESMIAATQIGFVIPVDEIKQDLEGRVVTFQPVNVYRQNKALSFQVEARACDPALKVRRVAAQYWLGQIGSVRPKDPELKIPIHGAVGDTPKRFVDLKRDPNDPTGQRWIADVNGLDLGTQSEFWMQAGYTNAAGKFIPLPSVNHTLALAKIGTGPNPASNAVPSKGGNQPPMNHTLQLGGLIPRAIVPPVKPYDGPTPHRPFIEEKGIPTIPTTLVKYPISNISHIAVSPSGDAVYITRKEQAEVKKYDPLDYSTPIATAMVGEFAESLWCDAERVAVACRKSGPLVIFSSDLTLRLAEVNLPGLVPHAIAGRAPDNSLITIWRKENEAVDQINKQYIYLIDIEGAPRLVGSGSVEHAVFCHGNSKMLLQRYRGSPAGAPSLFDIAAQNSTSLSQFQGVFASGMHNDFYQFYPTQDEKYLVMSGRVPDNYNPITKLVSPDLRRTGLTFEGVTIAEDAANERFIVVHSMQNKGSWVPEVDFIDSNTGKVLREVIATRCDLHPATFTVPRSAPCMLYVPGHEQVLFNDSNSLSVMNCSIYEAASSKGTGRVPDMAQLSPSASAITGPRASQVAPSVVPRAPVADATHKGNLLQAQLASRFRDAVPLAEVVPSAKNNEEEPIKAKREVDKAGLPITMAESKAELIHLGEGPILQIVADPSGQKLYACIDRRSTISVISTYTFKQIGEIAVPQYPVSLGFRESTLVVACKDSGLIAFVDTQSNQVTASVKLEDKEITPKSICGIAPDGSVVTIWNDGSVYLIKPDQVPLKVCKYSADWCTFAKTGRKFVLQSNFNGSPSGAVSLLDTSHLPRENFPLAAIDHGEEAFGRKNFDFHRSCGHTFMTRDLTRFLLPISNDGEVERSIKYPVGTLIIQPDLNKIMGRVPGCVLTECESIDSYVAWRSLDGDKPDRPIEILYISRTTGRIYRRIRVDSLSLDRRISPASHALPSLIYVPGRELIISHDPTLRSPWTRFQVARCGPIAEEALVPPDVKIKSASAPPALVHVDKPVQFQPTIELPSNFKGRVRYRLKPALPGITINPDTAEINFAPKASHLGKYDLQIIAEADGQSITVLSWVLEIDS